MFSLPQRRSTVRTKRPTHIHATHKPPKPRYQSQSVWAFRLAFRFGLFLLFFLALGLSFSKKEGQSRRQEGWSSPTPGRRPHPQEGRRREANPNPKEEGKLLKKFGKNPKLNGDDEFGKFFEPSNKKYPLVGTYSCAGWGHCPSSFARCCLRFADVNYSITTPKREEEEIRERQHHRRSESSTTP